MGNLWARFRHKDVRIILLGLDSAGKTTILYRLKLDDLVTTIPTIGFNVESLQYKDLHMTAWDIGSRDKIRPLFRHYYKGADAVVFVIDSHDRERLDELNYDVIKPAVSAEELTNAVFLFLANKMDLPDTMTVEEISEKLGLRFLKHPWDILPVSAISGEGLLAALEWLAVRLGSTQVKPRHFTTAHSQPKPPSDSSAASSSSHHTPSKTDNSKSTSCATIPQRPVILVNSKLLSDTRRSSSQPVNSADTPPIMTMSTPASSYSAFLQRRTPGTVLNSFSSYSIAQSMKEDLSRRKFSAISKSDLRKMSCASLTDNTTSRKTSSATVADVSNVRKLSSVSLMDSPNRRKASTSFVIEPVCGKFTSAAFMEAAYARKLSAASVSSDTGDSSHMRKLSSTSTTHPYFMEAAGDNKLRADSLDESQEEAENDSMSNLTSVPDTLTSLPTAKQASEDLSLPGFGKCLPILSDYVQNNRKDSDMSMDSVNLTSPSEHLQPHLRALGLQKSPCLSSNSSKMMTNPVDTMKEEHYNEILQLLPEKYTSMYTKDTIYAKDIFPQHQDILHEMPLNQNSRCSFDDTNGNTSSRQTSSDRTDHSNKNSPSLRQLFKSGRQKSQDSNSSASSGNGKHSNLDLFCTPARKPHSEKHSKPGKEFSSDIMPATTRAAYCSRAYSAIKCLFFRPTKQEMQQETNSLSSDDDEANDNNHTVEIMNVDVTHDVDNYCYVDRDNKGTASWQDCSLH